jgi:hypothetical protein
MEKFAILDATKIVAQHFVQFKEKMIEKIGKIYEKVRYYGNYKVVKVILTKNTTLQRMEPLSPIECNCIRN